MAIKQLTDEQVRTMTVEEKDRWWLENVYQGDVRQMTVRVVICGFFLGGVLTVTNLYVGIKTGWSLGVGVTSVVLAFVIFRLLTRIGLGRNYHILENNILQSIATAAGYMTGPMISSMPAYMILTGKIVPKELLLIWLVLMAILGVLFAFPMKRRFINDEQQPFPEGRAAAVVLDALHSETSASSTQPAKMLLVFGAIGAILKFGQAHAIMQRIWLGFLSVPEFLDGWYYYLAEKYHWAIPKILGTPLKDLTIRPELDVAMIGAGGLMGIRTGVSLMIGAVINYFILAPLMIQVDEIRSAQQDAAIAAEKEQAKAAALQAQAFVPERMTDSPATTQTALAATTTIPATGAPASAAVTSVPTTAPTSAPVTTAPTTAPADAGPPTYGFKQILKWSLWPGVAMMTVASLMSFFAKPQIFIKPIKRLFAGSSAPRGEDCLKDIELPLWVSAVGIPVVGVAAALLTSYMFDVQVWLGLVAVPLVFVFSLIAVNSTALTSVTPTGALAKITQLTYGVLAPGQINTNIATAAITGEVSGNTANLIQNIKPGYMLGAKPRLQALAHVIGAFSGSFFVILVFYPLFLKGDPNGLITESQPYPAASAWMAVAKVLTEGISELPYWARWAAGIGAVLGLVLEGVRMRSKGRFPISPVGIGLGFIISFSTCFAMFLGAFIIWAIGKRWTRPDQWMNRAILQNYESVCAGLVAGAALVGIAVMAIETFLLG
ncbi:MAG: OPT/YSL family transporter [Phycisphaerae bacterium]|nr:OPT/YSL family transporter [Phycisphaerae bacterium]